jgi:hypothetical protein
MLDIVSNIVFLFKHIIQNDLWDTGSHNIKNIGLNLLLWICKLVKGILSMVHQCSVLHTADHGHKDIVLGFGLAPHIQLLHTQRNVTGKALSTYPVDTLESGPCNPLIFPKFLHDANPGLLHTRTTTHLPHNSLACLLACSLSLTTTSTFALFSHQKKASQIKQNKITPDFFCNFFSGFLPSLPAFPHTNQ